MKEIDLEKLFSIAGERALSLEAELDNFARLLQHNFELRVFFEGPAARTDKKSLLLEILPEVTELFLDLIYLLIDQGWEKKIISLSQAFTRLVSKKMGINFVAVKSAYHLTQAERQKIANFVGGKVEVRSEVEPTLIGGIKLKTSDGRCFDASLQGQLERLKEELIYV